MAHLPASTFRILKEKSSNHDIDETWIDWALEMIEAGFESISLYELAGKLRPFNQFALQDLTNQVFKSLGLDYSDRKKVIYDYAYFLISTSLNERAKYFRVLREFRDIYYEQNMEDEFADFALLYWAKGDLMDSEVQWYWDGATRTNIDSIIENQFTLWLLKYKSEHHKSG